jgi:hypothetical protein
MKTLREMIDIVEGRGVDVQRTFDSLEDAGFITGRGQDRSKERIYWADVDTIDPSPSAVAQLFKSHGWEQMKTTFTGYPLPKDILLFVDDSLGGGKATCKIEDGIVTRIHFNFHSSND